MDPNGLEALARATPIAAAASAPNPRASVNGWPGAVSTSAVCTTLPSVAAAVPKQSFLDVSMYDWVPGPPGAAPPGTAATPAPSRARR